MTDRPILFSAPMVRALLAGRKTQTRRVIKPRRHASLFNGSWADSYVLDPGNEEWRQQEIRIKVGDRLWVRESWSGLHQFRDTPPVQRESYPTPDGPVLREDVWLWADGNPTGGDYERPRPGIHMPRWASRLTLTVTGVRVERLQDISEDDARAEGIVKVERFFGLEDADWDCASTESAVDAYAALWETINGDGAWAANPWVVAYTFTVAKQNIDQIGRAA